MRIRWCGRGFAALLAALLGAACEPAPAAAPPLPKPVTLRIGTSGAGGGFESFADALVPALKSRLTKVDVRTERSLGAIDNLLGVARGDMECGFTYSDVAYEALVRGRVEGLEVPMGDVRAIAVLQVTPVELIARAGSGIRQVADLRGKQVAISTNLSATSLVARLVLEAHGIAKDVRQVPGSRMGLSGLMAAGKVDATFGIVLYDESFASAIGGGAYVVPITGPIVDRLREQRPFMRNVLIPAATYGPGRPPVPTIGLESLLVCRRELDESVVRDLTRSLLESLPVVARSKDWNLVPFDEAPATSIPLHAGAALHYREMELTR